jgi:hypothetical protein
MRAGDYSFNHIGVTSMYMLMSTIPEKIRKEKGFYTVGGCAGNSWAWHTENDTLEVADPEVLLTDIKIYIASIYRILNAYIYPFDFRKWAEEAVKLLEGYQTAGENLFDLKPAIDEIQGLRQAFSHFYSEAENTCLKKRKNWGRFKKIDQSLLELGRILIPIDYTKGERYSHDPAIHIPSFPAFEGVHRLPQLSPETNEYRFLKTQLLRNRNRVIDALRRAKKEMER